MAMRRFNFMIDPELDELLESEARRRSISKGALVRQVLKKHVKPLPPLEEDPIWGIVGMYEGGPDDSSSIDEVVYDLNR